MGYILSILIGFFLIPLGGAFLWLVFKGAVMMVVDGFVMLLSGKIIMGLLTIFGLPLIVSGISIGYVLGTEIINKDLK